MNRELFIGAIDLTEHVFRVEPYYLRPNEMANILHAGKNPLKRYDIWLSYLADPTIYNLKQMCIYRPLPAVFFNGYGFKIQLSDFNDYSLKLCESVSVGVELILIFEQEFKIFTMSGRFGR